MAKEIIEIVTLPHGEGIELPSYKTDGAAGMDIRAAIDKDLTIAPGQREAVPTGFEFGIPDGFEVQIRPRSGLANKHGLIVANAPGTIDSDYRGEVKVLLINLGTDDIVIKRGMRIAQMVIAPVTQADFKSVETLSETKRDKGGFGSTGEE